MIRQVFKNVHYYPEGAVPRDVCKEADVWFNPHFALPDGITLDDVPRTKLIQLDAGALSWYQEPPWLTLPQPEPTTRLVNLSLMILERETSSLCALLPVSILEPDLAIKVQG
jgi:hypothetical protein